MPYIIDENFDSGAAWTDATPHSTITYDGNYNLVVSSYVDFGNGSYHTAGWTYEADSILYMKFRMSNTTDSQTAVKFGERRNSTAITDEGYDLYVSTGTIGGTSWGPSTGFADRAIAADTDYWIRYTFKSGGDLQVHIKGGAFADWTGIRDMAGAGISNGTIRWHINAAGISPNDGTGTGLKIDRIVVAESGDADPSAPAVDPPVVDAGIDQEIDFPDSASLTASNSGGAVDTWAWSKVSGPGDVVFTSAATAATDVSVNAGGTYVLRITATNAGGSDTDDLTLTVDPANLLQFNRADSLTDWTKKEAHGTVTVVGSTNKRLQITSDSTSPGAGAILTNPHTLAAHVISEWQFEVDDYTGGQFFMGLSDEADVTLHTTGPRSVIFFVESGAIQARGVDTANTVEYIPVTPTALSAGVYFCRIVAESNHKFTCQYRRDNTSTWTVLAQFATTDFTDWYGSNYYLVFQHRTSGGHNLLIDAPWTAGAPTPTVSAGPDQTVGGVLVATLAGSGSVPSITAFKNSGYTDANSFELDSITPTYLWTKSSGPGTLTFVDATSPITNVTASVAGEYVLNLNASGLGGSADDTVTLDFNVPPLVDAGPDQRLYWNLTSVTAQLAGTVSDDGFPSPSSVSQVWTMTAGPKACTFDDATKVDAVATFTYPGHYSLALTATDGQLTTVDSINIRVARIGSFINPFTGRP